MKVCYFWKWEIQNLLFNFPYEWLSLFHWLKQMMINSVWFSGQWSAYKCQQWILDEAIRYHYPELVANAKAYEEVQIPKTGIFKKIFWILPEN